jgi:hypothetical protein
MTTLPRFLTLVLVPAAALLALPVATSPAVASGGLPTTYTITDISLPGSTYSIGYGVNEAGVAVVHGQDPNAVYPDPGYGAYRYSGSGLVHLTAIRRPWAVNASGAVVGEATDGQVRAVPGGQTDSPGEGRTGAMQDIADDGTAAGYVYADSGSEVPATLGSDGTVTELALPAGADFGYGQAINESGTVVGHVEDYGDDSGLGAYSEAVEWDALGAPTLLTNAGPDDGAYAQDVDESGDVLIHFASGSGLIRNADGTSTAVPGLGGFVEPQRMNDARQVVGRTSYANGQQTAFLFDAATDTTVDLQDLIPADAGWTLHVANDINDKGQIVGYGYRNGVIAAFLLTPVTAGSVSATVTGGGTVTTDPTAQGATADVPVQTTVIVPSSVSGTVSATLQSTTSSTPTGFVLFGKEVVLNGPTASVSAPYQVTFSVDGTLLGALLPTDLDVFRNGSRLSACTDPSAAVPDPCIVDRAAGRGDDALVTVRTSHFSTWSLGRPSYTVSGPFGAVSAPPIVNTAVAGSAIPVNFSLGGNRGLDVFRAGYPKTAPFTCSGTTKTKEVKQTVKAGSSSLSYNFTTGSYQYTWKTPKTLKGCIALDMSFHDGSSVRTLFRLR